MEFTPEELDFLDDLFMIWCKWTEGNVSPDKERIYNQLDEKFWGK